MYPAKFDYYRAESVEEALQLLKEHEDAKLLAGGHSLLPVMKLRLAQPPALIDIGRIAELKGISGSNGSVRIGALTTHSEVEAADNLPAILTETAGWIGDPQVRNRGTVGGNIAHADPASDLPTVLVALDARLHIQGSDGTRTVSAGDFFTGLFETALGEDELLTAIEVDSEQSGWGSAYAKLYNPASRYAMVGAAAVVRVDNGTVGEVRVAIGGLTPNAIRCPSVEAALQGGGAGADSLQQAAQAVVNDLDDDDLIGDMHASAQYRKSVAPEMIRRALATAVERAG